MKKLSYSCLEKKMSTCNVFMFLLTSILLLSVYGEQGKTKHEDTCGPIVEVLCVKESLNNIVKAAKEIRVIADEIEGIVVNMILIKLFLIIMFLILVATRTK
jgi:hypothetical protein